MSKLIPRKFSGVLLAPLLAVVVLLSGLTGAWVENRQHSDGGGIGSLSDQKRVVASQSQLISRIAKTVGPSVVSVNVNITDSGSLDAFGFSKPQKTRAAGTGIIISRQGLIMTNRHVVPAGTTDVSVTLSDGTELDNVTVVGRTAETDSLDVAFLKITTTKGHKLTPAALGNSAAMQVGDSVVAIGNALGQFQNTVTSGIISGFGRRIQASDSSGSAAVENLDGLFQTDAAINEGNSGGPLVNLDGQVIGINTAVAGDAQNIGFAIPISDVQGLISQVIKTGKFARPYLGVRYVPLTADIAAGYGLKVTQGAFIVPAAAGSGSPSVPPDGPAAKAGVKEKDIITAVNDKKIDQTHSLTSLLTSRQPGDKVKLAILRDSKTIHLTITLGELPSR